ncbi:MAG: hypothetical protein QOH57_3952 [Mycobacterium sp.]|nr:hypothetical protein [Mycobacterium sp.]
MVSTGVHRNRFTLLVLVAVAACSVPAHGPPDSSSTTRPGQTFDVNPENIRRMRGAFPPGFEITDTQGDASPATFWGLKPGWTSEPPECGGLADPAAGPSSPRGLSGSGNGGIIYVVVKASASAVRPDPGAVKACSHWSMDSGRTTAIVDAFDPAIDGVSTFGMLTAIRTVVEGGNETDLRAFTVTAYLGEYIAFVTVVTDPGSEQSALTPDLAKTMLTRTVAALRG